MRKERSLAWFAAAAATYLVLGLTTEQRICLYRECLSIAKEDNDRKLLVFCAFCLASLYEQPMSNPRGNRKGESSIEDDELGHCLTMMDASLEQEIYDRAILYGERCLAMAKTSGIELFEILVYLTLTIAHLEKKEYGKAISNGNECLSLAQESGDKEKEMEVYMLLERAHMEKKEYDDVISCGKKCLPIAQECGDKEKEMKVYMILGFAHMGKKEYDDVIFYTKKSLAMMQESCRKDHQMDLYLTLGVAHAQKQEYDDAISCAKKCLPITQECGDKEKEIIVYSLLGDVHIEKEEYDDGIFYTKKSLAMMQESCRKDHQMDLYLKLEYAHSKKQEYDEAISCGKKCLPIAQECGDKEKEMEVYLLLGHAHMEKKEYDEAISCGKKCLPIAQECGNKEKEMAVYILLGSAHMGKKEYDDGIFCIKKSLAMMQESCRKDHQMDLYLQLGLAHEKKQEYDDAISCGKKCLPIAQECGNKEKEMAVYILLGSAHMGTKEYDDVIFYTKKIIAMAKESGDKVVEMKALLTLAGAHGNKQEYDEAISCGKKCLPIEQECGDKEEEMEVYLLLGHTHMEKKEYDEAISCGKKCLPIAQECGNKEKEMAVYMLLRSAHMGKKEYDDVIFYTKKSIAMAKESDNKEVEMKALRTLTAAHLNKQEYDEAISCGKKCLPIAQECGDKKEEMDVYLSLGHAHMRKGECDTAVSCYQNCLTIMQQSDDKMDMVGKTYAFLGEAHLSKEECDKAILCGQKCLAIAQESGDKEGKMRACELLGDAHWKTNAYDDAYSCFLEGRKIAMDLQKDTDKFVFESYLNMIYGEVGVEIPNDHAYFFYAFRESLRFNPKNDTNDWATAYNWYDNHRKAHRYEKALSHLKEAEATLQTTQPGSLQYRKRMWCCKQGMSDMHVKLGQHDEAMKYQQEALDVAVTNSQKATSHFSLGKLYYERQELENAKQSLEESLESYELIFKELKQNDRFKIAFVDKYKEVYKMLLKVLIETNKIEEALFLSDRHRAKALKDLLVSSYEMKKDPTAEEADYLQYADVQSLVSCRDYSLLFYSACDEKLCTFLVQAGNDLEFSLQHFEYCDKCLDQLVVKAFVHMKVRQVVNCEDRSLDVVENSEEKKNPNEDELSRLLTRQIEKRLTQQCSSICGCRGEPSENTDESSLTSGLEILHHKLIHNIKHLIKKDEIVIIPEGPLYKVPFAALQDPDTRQYLSETKRFRIAPSISTLKLLQEYSQDLHSNKEALIIGHPVTGKVLFNGTETEFDSLDGAIKEAKEVANIFAVDPLLESMATKSEVVKRLREGASVVHIAAHGSLEKAAIVLSPTPEVRAAKIPDEEDYLLTMADVQQTQVRAQLVVLACCYSGRGKIKAEGVVGMCRAFLASGARAVVGSLWAVNDKATRTFMETFYKYLKDGKSASTSLHLTMNDTRRTPEYSEPKYWASFFLMGDDVTIKFDD